MSSIFKNLSEEVKVGKESTVVFPAAPASAAASLPPSYKAPKLTGIKVSIFLAFILSLAALAGSYMLFHALNAEKKERKVLEASQIQVREKSSSLEKVSDQYKSEIERMREQLKTYATARDDFQRELDQSRTLIAGLQKRLRDIEEKNRAIEEQTRKFQLAANEAEVQPKQDEEAVDGEPAAAQAAPAAAPKPAQVLTVNRKFNFVVVNAGLRDNVKIGDSLDIERNGKVVASAQVEKLYDNFSAATITKEPKNDLIKEGDIVRRP